MYHLENIEINGFWGNYSVKTPLNKNVNIFIGANGTGKTTLINILKSILTVDLPYLINIDFSKVKLRLKQSKKVRTITVTKNDPSFDFENIMYKIGRQPGIVIPLFGQEAEYRRKRMHSLHIDKLREVRKQIATLINLCWLSVHREILEIESLDMYHRKVQQSKNNVDLRLEELMKNFTRYQLLLESKIGEYSDKFQKDVLLSMLYDENLDLFSVETDLDVNLPKVKKGLIHAYQELGVPQKVATEKIEKHIKVIGDSIKVIRRESKKDKPAYYVRDILPLPLLKRAKHIIDLSLKAEERKKEINEPVEKYIDLLNGFAKFINFKLSPSRELIIVKDGVELPIEQLSSGEKQLVIFLTETLLQENKPYTFIADEPELSLHIAWQRRLLSAIKDINKNCQIIVATHSPEIAARHKSEIIRMEDIVHA